MKIKYFIITLIILFLVPFSVFPKTVQYMKVGYIDLDKVIQIYTPKYLEAEIKLIEDDISLLQITYSTNYFKLSEQERHDMQNRLDVQNSKLSVLKSNWYFLEKIGEISDDVIFDRIQKNIMEAIKKTCISEGYSMVIDRTENFIYGSDDIDLTHKVLFRLEEKLLNKQISELDEDLVF